MRLGVGYPGAEPGQGQALPNRRQVNVVWIGSGRWTQLGETPTRAPARGRPSHDDVGFTSPFIVERDGYFVSWWGRPLAGALVPLRYTCQWLHLTPMGHPLAGALGRGAGADAGTGPGGEGKGLRREVIYASQPYLLPAMCALRSKL